MKSKERLARVKTLSITDVMSVMYRGTREE